MVVVLTGIESVPELAKQASKFTDKIIEGDIETLDLKKELSTSKFDVILIGDFLEYLNDPEKIPKLLINYLKPDGYFVMSIPNIAHGSIRLKLLNGIFDTPTQYRFDGIYGMQWTKKLLRVSKQKPDLHFDATSESGNAHCPSVPQNSIGWENSVRSNIKILHYGYYDKSLRQKKYDFMKKLDPGNIEFDGYKHILGKGKHTGKFGIELKSLPDELIPNYPI
mgnify:CR=1 FL=1